MIRRFVEMEVKLKGTTVTLEGIPPKKGEKAPDFSLVNLDKQIIQLSDLLAEKPVLLSVVPDIDTRVCSIQTKRFNQEIGQLPNVHFVTISNNTREEQADWCAAEGVEMELLHDTDLKFGSLFGLFIPEFGHLARSIFVIGQDGTIEYEEIVPEISQEPDYESALAVAKKL